MIPLNLILQNSQIINKFGDLDSLNSFYGLCTNSRELKKDDFFVGIKGQHFDGFSYVESVLSKTNLFVFESSKDNLEKLEKIKNESLGKIFLEVKDSVKFIQDLCKDHCRQWSLDTSKKIIAISGSNGKTTTKDMLGFLLKSIDSKDLVVTHKNDNNHLGVPFTILKISKNTEVAVVEYGSNHPGEIPFLCEITFPRSGIVTNIADTHMEFFETKADVFKEESSTYKRVNELTDNSGFFLINEDDEYLKNLKKTNGSKTFSFKNKSADYFYCFNRNDSEISINNEVVLKNLNILGEHNFLNLANAFLLALNIYPQKKSELLKAASLFIPKENRSQWINWKNKKVFLDAYNANPHSMQISIKEFVLEENHVNSKKILILGDMNELGENSEKYHEELGQYLNSMDVDIAYVGKFSEFFKKGFKKDLVFDFQKVETHKNEIINKIYSYDCIFAKASRSLQLESIFDII